MSADPLRVLFVAPYPLDVAGGNSTAILRLVRQLGLLARAAGERFEAPVAT